MKGMKPTFFILGFLLGSQLVTDASAGTSSDYYKQDYHTGEYQPSPPPKPQRRKYKHPTVVESYGETSYTAAVNPPVDPQYSSYEQNNEEPTGSNYDYTENVPIAPPENSYVAPQENLYQPPPPEESQYVASPDGSYTTDTGVEGYPPGMPDSGQPAYPEQPTLVESYAEPSYTAPDYAPAVPKYPSYKQPRPQIYEPAPPIYRPKKRNYQIQFYLKQKRKGSYQNQGIAYGTRYTTQDNQYGGSAQYQPEIQYGKKKRPHSPPKKQQSAPKHRPHSSSTRNPTKGKARHSKKKSTKSDKVYKMRGMDYV